jgi:hypothetical protein
MTWKREGNIIRGVDESGEALWWTEVNQTTRGWNENVKIERIAAKLGAAEDMERALKALLAEYRETWLGEGGGRGAFERREVVEDAQRALRRAAEEEP